MTQLHPVTTGWRVVEPRRGKRGQVIKPAAISGTFTVKSAADEFARLARAAGRTATVETVAGLDDVGGAE